MAIYLLRADGAVHLYRTPWRLNLPLMRDILHVGLPASMSPVISNASIAASTAFVGSYGTAALAGYGVAARLEHILVPFAFGFGTALTAMVATNMGAGQSARALRVAWTGGAMVTAITGLIGLVTAVAPLLWMHLFTTDAAVLSFGASYLHIVGACYAFFGLALCARVPGAGHRLLRCRRLQPGRVRFHPGHRHPPGQLDAMSIVIDPHSKGDSHGQQQR